MGIRSKAIFDWQCAVHVVDENDNIIETLALADSLGVGLGAYRAAVKMRANSTIQLREKARIVWTAKTGPYDLEKHEVPLIWER